MKYGIRTMDEIDVENKTVLIRVDINQPVDPETGYLRSTKRIEACAPTIRELSERKAKVVILAHEGSDIEYRNFASLRTHSRVLSKLLGTQVHFIEDVVGPTAINKIKGLHAGEILLLENVRFMSEEQTLFERSLKLTHEQMAKTIVVQKLAPLADLYICDAFAAAHRDQPSLCGFEQVLPSAMGRLFEKEYTILSDLMAQPEHPCTFVLGGAKIADAFMMMNAVLQQKSADHILVGGVAGNIVLEAEGKEIGQGSHDFIVKNGFQEYIDVAKKILEQYPGKLVTPVDLAWVENGERKEAKIGKVPDDITALDVGSETAALYGTYIKDSKTVFVNGPMGVFEEDATELGTKAVWEALGTTEAFTVVGGGDSITATTKYGKTKDISYICTGGGALIRFMTGEELPVVRALRHGSKILAPLA